MATRRANNDTPLAFGGNVLGAGVYNVRIPAAAATAVFNLPIFVADHKIKVTKVQWVPAAAVTGAATNNFALGVVNVGDAGTGTVAVTVVKTYASGTNSVARKAEVLTLSATAANLNLATGDVVTLERTVNGTGLASPEGVVQIHFVSQ